MWKTPVQRIATSTIVVMLLLMAGVSMMADDSLGLFSSPLSQPETGAQVLELPVAVDVQEEVVVLQLPTAPEIVEPKPQPEANLHVFGDPQFGSMTQWDHFALTVAIEAEIVQQVHPMAYGWGPEPVGIPLDDAVNSLKFGMTMGTSSEEVLLVMQSGVDWLLKYSPDTANQAYDEYLAGLRNTANYGIDSGAQQANSYRANALNMLASGDLQKEMEVTNAITALVDWMNLEIVANYPNPAEFSFSQPSPYFDTTNATNPIPNPSGEHGIAPQALAGLQIPGIYETDYDVGSGQGLVLPDGSMGLNPGIAFGFDSALENLQGIIAVFRGLAQSPDRWVIVDVRQVEQPFSHWSLFLVREDTFTQTWEHLPEGCQTFMQNQFDRDSGGVLPGDNTVDWALHDTCMAFFEGSSTWAENFAVQIRADDGTSLFTGLHYNPKDNMIDAFRMRWATSMNANLPNGVGDVVMMIDMPDIISALLRKP